VFTVKVTVAEPPPGLEIVAMHVPAFCGVTTSANVSPDPVGVANVTIALLPVPQVDVTFTAATAAFVVIVTVWLNAAPTPAKLSELGEALSWPAGAALPVLNGGGLAPPP